MTVCDTVRPTAHAAAQSNEQDDALTQTTMNETTPVVCKSKVFPRGTRNPKGLVTPVVYGKRICFAKSENAIESRNLCRGEFVSNVCFTHFATECDRATRKKRDDESICYEYT